MFAAMAQMSALRDPEVLRCFVCTEIKERPAYSVTQLKKHDKRVCTPCVAAREVEFARHRALLFHQEVTRTSGAAAIALAESRRAARRDKRKADQLVWYETLLADMIRVCRQHYDAWRQRSVASSADQTNLLNVTDYYTPTPCTYPVEQSPPVTVDWPSLPASVDPARSGGLQDERAVRKRLQVEYMLSLLQPLLKPGMIILDVGSATGNFSLPLAALFPQSHFLLLDRDARSLQLALARAEAAGLSNVGVLHGLIEQLSPTVTFDVCIAMHACGVASDWAQIQAIQRHAMYGVIDVSLFVVCVAT